MAENFNDEKYLKHQIIEEYEAMQDDAEAFANDCKIFDDFYDGDHWKHPNIILSSGWNLENTFMEDAVRVVENQCKSVISVNSEILMNSAPKFRVPKPQEENPFVDVEPYDEETDKRQIDQITDIEKCLRLILKKTKAHVQLMNGASNGCLYGRTLFLGKIFNNPEYGKLAGFKNLAPQTTRIKFRTGSDMEVEKIYWEENISPREAKSRYAKYLKANEVEIFDTDDYIRAMSSQEYGMSEFEWNNSDYTAWREDQEAIILEIFVVHCFDGENYSVAYKNKILFREEHNIARIAEDGEKLPPAWFIPNAPMGIVKGAGQSDIREILPTQILINKYKSMEFGLLDGSIFPSKELISNREGVLEAIATVKQFNVRLNPGESINFKSPQINSYPLAQAIKDNKQHVSDVTGRTNAVMGDPAGSINTGPALKIQYHPVERKILKKCIYWIAELESLYSWMLKITAENNPKFAELIHYEGKPYTMVDVYWDVKTPQDEAVAVTNDVNLVQAGIISKESAARKRDVKNVEYEMEKIAIEKMKDAQIEAEAQAMIQGAEGGAGGPAGAGGPSPKDQQAAIAMADEENFQMASGKETPPTDPASVADWEAHNNAHMEFIQSEQFASLPDGVKQLFEYHLQNVDQQGGEGAPSGGGGTPGPAPEEHPRLDQSQNKTEESPMGKELPVTVRLNNLKQKGSV